ncbi:O-antigen ligase family protein [Psychrobacter faecalis]|uniref:O-antigen ligase family protein n=1 Tax=Psychrobacter faecalis TaxID=180588 RepID=UPI003FD5FFDE
MLKKYKLYQFFIITIFASTFLGYFFNSGIIAYGPLIFLLLCITIQEMTGLERLPVKDWVAVLIWIPYVAWAGLYYILNPFEGRYLTTHFLVIITIPFIVLSFLRLSNNRQFDYNQFIYKLVLYFLVAETIICIGQFMTYTIGIGLPVTEEQAKTLMVAGTFANSNDLGGVVLILTFIFSQIEKYINKNTLIIWILILILLLITASRSALFVAFFTFIITRGFGLKKILSYTVVSVAAYFIISILFSMTDIEAVNRSVTRLESIFTILEEGASADNSITLRLDSYLHFIKNITELGLGSGEVNNYFKYANNAIFDTSLLLQNPHSLLVEIGYWLGYPGLIFFITAMVYLFRYSESKVLFFIVLITSTLIPSSILGNLTYFLLMMCALLLSPKIENNSKILV